MILQTIAIPAAGTYTIVVGGSGATSGDYTARVILNAAAEEEEHDGAGNDTPATAQDLDASFISPGVC